MHKCITPKASDLTLEGILEDVSRVVAEQDQAKFKSKLKKLTADIALLHAHNNMDNSSSCLFCLNTGTCSCLRK